MNKLTSGITSAGLSRFFVRRQNKMKTTKIRIIMTNDTDATIILNTGLVSIRSSEKGEKKTRVTLIKTEYFMYGKVHWKYSQLYLVVIIQFDGYRCHVH